MKSTTLLLTMFLLSGQQAISSDAIQTTQTKEILAVESGLRGENHFQGEKTWQIKDRMAHYGVPGVSVAVIKDFKLHWVKHYGVTDKETNEAVNDQTLFQAGSISKPVAAYGALKMVENKQLSLNTPVNTQLKDWQIPDNTFTQQKAVTLKQLLNHSAGLTVHGFGGYPVSTPVPSVIQILNGTAPANSAAVIADLVPETQFRYSGGGYTVMQKLVSDVSEKAYPSIMNELVLSPLKMKHSTYEQPLPPEKLKHAAAGYLPNKSPVSGKRHTYPEMAAAGLWTTAEDLAKFAIDVQTSIKNNKGHVLKQATVEKMLTPFVSDRVGLGLFIDDRKGEIYFGHGGWDEGFSADMVAHKTKGYGVVIMTNSNHPAFIEELKFAVAAEYQWDHFVSPSLKSLSISKKDIARVSGRYQFDPDMTFTIYEKDGHLFMQYLNGEPMEVLRIGDNQYVRREIGAKFRFEKTEENGEVNLVFGINGEKEHIRKRLAKDQFVPFEWAIKDDIKQAKKGYLDMYLSHPTHFPHAEYNLLTFAQQLNKKDKTKQALLILELSAQLFPMSYNSLSSLAEHLQLLGKKEEAINYYKKVLAIKPNDKTATNALNKMEKQ